MNYYTINMRSFTTEDKGALSFFEGMRDLPFDIKRIYYIYGVGADVVRGGHAHKELKQVLFCPYGKIILEMDDGKKNLTIGEFTLKIYNFKFTRIFCYRFLGFSTI